MLFFILHLLACGVLVAAAVYRLYTRGTAPAYGFLFPYIIVAALAGMVISYMYAGELFVAWYSGAAIEIEAAKYRLSGPYAWVYISMLIAPLLPVFAIIPWVGRRPLAVALLGLLAVLPGFL
ncbi:hypothetical protein [Luteolibacter sp. Populi]|uniref:hypothetical protein n=1 Tax=Luteolibacter sp. Populi TaxID=3230487 RepID=UPI003467BAD6